MDGKKIKKAMASKSKKLPKAMQRRQGQLTYYNVLKRQGRTAEAEAWAARHKLYAIPPLYPSFTLSAQATTPTAASPNLATADTSALVLLASSTANTTLPSAPLLASPRSATPLPAASSGGAGAGENGLAQNLDQSPHRGEILQLALAKAAVARATVVGSAPDGACPASPSGEVEGNKQICQDDKGALFSNRLESGWVVSGEGVVGGNCRNKWFVEVSVDGKWAKAAVGDVLVKRGTRVRVRLEWVSADAEVETVLAAQLHQRLVGSNARSLQSLRGQLTAS